MTSQARQRRGPLPCAQEGCYYPETGGDLRWCTYVGYHCPRPEPTVDAAPEQPEDTAPQPADTGPRQLELLPGASPA